MLTPPQFRVLRCTDADRPSIKFEASYQGHDAYGTCESDAVDELMELLNDLGIDWERGEPCSGHDDGDWEEYERELTRELCR